MKKIFLLISIICSFSALANLSAGKATYNNRISSPSMKYYSQTKLNTNGFEVKSKASPDISPITRSEAADELIYSVSQRPGDPADALNFGETGNDKIYLAFCFESDEIKKYIGSEISNINVTAPIDFGDVNPIKEVTVFISKDLGKSPVYSQVADLGEVGFAVNSIKLDTPYKIQDDSPLYIGYFFTCDQTNVFYLPFDNERSDKKSNLFAISGDSWPDEIAWGNLAPDNGNLCMSVTLKGDNLPKDCAVIIKADIPENIVPENFFGCWLTIANKGVTVINDLEIKIDINGIPSFSFPQLQGLEPNQAIELYLDNLYAQESGIFDIEANITKVNGVDNIYSSDSKIKQVACFSGGFLQNAVVEEATGTWCGYCPAGIVMCEYIREKYEDRIFPIAVHQGDAMEISGYLEFINDFVSGYPTAIANRKENIFVGTFGADNLFDQISNKSTYCDVDLTASREDDVLSIDAIAEFALDTDIEHRLSFVVVEDGVGPYLQNNYYSGGSGLGLWNTSGDKVLTYFNDVARYIDIYEGLPGSLPNDIKEGEKYSFSHQIEIPDVKSSVFRVIAMITNAQTGEIINSAQYTVAPEGMMYLSKTELNMSVGDHSQLNAIIAGEDITEKTIEWSSSDATVATVDADGLVIACAPGEAVITASCDDKNASCKVSVTLIGGIVEVEDIRYKIIDDSSCGVAMPEIEGNYLMESVVIPPSIKAFNNEYDVNRLFQGAFSLCNNLKEIELPSTIDVLEGWAFNGCAELKNISIPSSVWLIDVCAFQTCYKLEKVELNEGITTIWHSAFAFCESLPEIVFPSTVYQIGSDALLHCENMERIVCESVYPPILDGSIFGDATYLYDTCVLYVPSKSIDMYKEDAFWGMFKNIEGIESDGVDEISLDDSPFDVYSLDGNLLIRNAERNDLTNCLKSGLYILRFENGNSRKVMIR